MSRITVEVTDEQHHKIKVLASLQNKTIKELVLDSLFDDSSRKYNRETIRAMEDVESRKHLNSYKTVSELFDKLGI